MTNTKRYDIGLEGDICGPVLDVKEHPTGDWVHWEDVEVLRGNLSLAEEGLANYALEVQRLKDGLGMIYDKWENGTACFEDADNTGISLGNAFRLTEDEEAKILALIPSRRSTPKANAVRLPNTLCPRCHQFHFEVEDTEAGCIQLLLAVVRKLRLAQPHEPEGGK